MKKIFTLFAAVICGLTLSAKTIYLNTGGSDLWNQAGAVFFAHSWASESDNADVQLTLVSGDIFSAEINDAHSNILFVRMPNGSTALDWSSKWNQTGDLQIPSDKNQYNITGWGDNDGNWSVYGEGGGDQPGEGGGDQPGGGDEDLQESGEFHDFALMGSIGGDWNVDEQLPEYTFDKRGRWTGTLAAHPAKPGASYVVLTDEEGNQYKTKGWQGEDAKKVTLYWANGWEDSNVWQLPAGQTIYLIMRSCIFKGAIEVERVDQATYDAYSLDWGTEDPGTDPGDDKALDENEVSNNTHKFFQNGQLYILRGEKIFDATGRQL